MVDLPYELWLHITSLLTDEEVWVMRTLNRTVREIALDRHFRKVVISMQDVYSREYRSRFSRFSDSNIPTRVRELEVLSVVYAMSKIAKPASSREKILSILSQSCRNLVKSNKDAVSDTLQTFTELKHVVLKFDFIQGMALSKIVRLLQNCLLPSANNLNSLEMSYPIELIGRTISPALLFPHLKSFTVTLFTHRNAAEAERLFTTMATTTLVPFINRHRFTLTTLNMWFYPLAPSLYTLRQVTSTNFNLSPMFTSLEHIPHLETLSISISASTTMGYISRLLKIHFTTLVHLSVVMADSKKSTRGVLDQFEVPMPKLEDFTLQYQYDTTALASSSYQESTLQFIPQHASSLVSMKLRNTVHNRDQFLTFFDPAVSYHKLKYLSMSLQILTPNILDIFVLHLHNLHHLYILVRFLKCRHKGHLAINEQEENEFCTVIKRRDFRRWSLKHLILIVGDDSRTDYISNGAAAVAEVMTSLETFNGMLWAEFIQYARQNAVPQYEYTVPWVI